MTLPEGLTTIWDLAFAGNALTTISIPSTVTEVRKNAFFNNNIYELVFAQGAQLNVIGEGAFGLNALADVTLPAGVVSIGDSAFSDNVLTSVTLSEGLTSIGSDALGGNSITSVMLPSGMTSIGDYSFYGNSLTSISIPDAVASIGTGAFAVNNLSSVSLPAGVTSIGLYAFQGNSLVNVVLPSGVTTIGGSAFQGNALASVVIPPAVNFLGPDAFASNPGLDSVRFMGGKPTTLGARLFDGTGSEPIYVPGGPTPSWAGIGALDGREVVVVPTPVITSQPTNQTLPVGGTVDLSVTIDPDTPEQGDVTYAWFKGDTKVSGDDAGATYTANSTGSYHVVVTSWAGSTSSANAKVSAPVVPPTPTPKPAPKPKPVVKKKQSAKVKLPSKLKRNRTYRLPLKTNAGVKLSWKVRGAGKCKVNAKKRTIKCRTATGKKYVTITGKAASTATYYPYKVTIKRRIR